MEQSEVIKRIKEVAAQILPEGSSLWLYGSRARGDAHPDSDYDLLILLNKDNVTDSDYSFVYPFRLMGWKINEEISPHIYSRKTWDTWKYLPFHDNVESDKVVLQ
jgi:predicted nucleotidyltransferase